ncbi:MAG: PIN domain-containing protein [Bacteroidia bacterium]
MKVVVDTNIVFSAILNSDGKIGDLLLNSSKYIDFFSIGYLHFELGNHYEKLSRISKQPIEKIVNTEYFITRAIKFISEEQIPEIIWRSAYALVKEVDLDDIAFVALSKHLKCKLWTGDGVLIRGLNINGFSNTISTDDLLKYRTLQERKIQK